MKKILPILLCFFTSCFSTRSYIEYQVSTNTDPYTFINITTFDLKLSENDYQNKIVEKKMLKMVEDALINRGWERSVSKPDYYVSLTFSISDGNTQTSINSRPATKYGSNYNYKTKTTTYTKDTYTRVSSNTTTTYERTINIYLHSKNRDLVWQGDLISHGTTQDIMYVAPHLIPQGIKYIGGNDVSSKYRHSCEDAGCLSTADVIDKKAKKKSRNYNTLYVFLGMLTSIILII